MFFLRTHNYRFLLFILISTGLCDIIFGQTFQYSRGWTNGKKRSSIESVLFPDTFENQEEYGICQMQRLREMWDSRRSEGVIIYLFFFLISIKNNLLYFYYFFIFFLTFRSFFHAKRLTNPIWK